MNYELRMKNDVTKSPNSPSILDGVPEGRGNNIKTYSLSSPEGARRTKCN
jgi:hypothetical protein